MNTLTLCPSPKRRGNGETATSGSLSLWEEGLGEGNEIKAEARSWHDLNLTLNFEKGSDACPTNRDCFGLALSQ